MAKKSTTIISEEAFIQCPYCDLNDPKNQLQAISYFHVFQKHGKSLDDLRKEFSGYPTMTKSYINNKKESGKKGAVISEAKREKMYKKCCRIECNELVEIHMSKIQNVICDKCCGKGYELSKPMICSNPKCGIKFDAPVNTRNDEAYCKKCQKEGFKNKNAQETGKLGSDIVKEIYGPQGAMSDPKIYADVKEKVKKAYVERGDEIILQRKENYKEKTGYDHQMHNPDVRDKFYKNADDYIKNYPWIFPKIEEIRDCEDGFGIEVRCKNHKCKKWFKPTYNQLNSRLYALTEGNDGHYLYCSDACKHICPLYNLNTAKYLNDLNDNQITDQEYRILRVEVLKRQKDKHGINFCEICQRTDNEVMLFAHHEKPKKLYPIFALDPDNCLILCGKCHHELHVDECSTGNLARKICL